MDPSTITHRLGSARVTPVDDVVAGEFGQWTLTYTVGSFGIDEGGTLKIARRFPSDWQRPQFDTPDGPGYTTVHTTGEARIAPHFELKGHERPWSRCLVLDVYDGSLAPGDSVTVVFGDRSEGSPGIRAQTFIESAHEFRVFVDPTNAAVARPLAESPKLRIVSGEPVELVCIVPSEASVRESVEVFVKGQDVWTNPTPVPDGLTLRWEGTGEVDLDGETCRLTVRSPGRGRVVAEAGGLCTVSNPLHTLSEAPPLRRYWGDLHAQTDSTVGTGTEREYFTFARDVAKLDFTSHQGNDFQLTDEDWRRLNDEVARFQEDGRFVVFPGYEWSANSPAGGDRNVFYLEEHMPLFRSSHWQVPEVPERDGTPAHPANVLFRTLRERVDTEKVLLGSHVGGRYADIRRYFDEQLGPLIELVSCWGVFEWLLWDAIEKDYVVGVMANSDGHKGRPGAEGPGAGQFGIANGLTCVFAEASTRRAIWDALRQRRCYGTTGPRIALDFHIDGEPMGALMRRDAPATARASVVGTTPMESLTLYAGREPIHHVQPEAFSRADTSRRVRVSWAGSRIRGRGRRATWDGEIRVEGCAIERAETFAFDAATDGIVAQDATHVRFRSQTTGDTDGIDLWLNQADGASAGRIVFSSDQGTSEVALDALRGDARRRTLDYGGLDMVVTVERYPEALEELELSLTASIEPPTARTAYFVKAVQSDGHMAWSSPIYLSR